MEPISDSHPLRRHFSAMVEHAFCTEVGVCDPRLTEYLAELLVSFTHIDRLNAMRRARGRNLEQVAAMLAILAEEKPPVGAQRDRAVYRNIGDYTLFWAGMFPEHLRRSGHVPTDALSDYVQQGKRSYSIVADLADEQDVPPPALFRHLSDDFEYCIYGLGLVRRDWEHAGHAHREGGELIF